MANPHPPRVGIGALAGQIQAGITAVGDVTTGAADTVTGPWRSLFTVVGQSGPQYLKHANSVVRQLRRYGG